MCGRLNVISDPLCQIVSEGLGVKFSTESNDDLCPSQKVSTIISKNGTLQQLDVLWGIQPNWLSRLLINAQSETVATKATFQHALQSNRCVVPCSGWYEWRTENGKKVKYLFEHSNKQPLFMAGLWYSHENAQLVTLTTAANEKCKPYHKRMPVLISPENISYWLQSSIEYLPPLFQAINDDEVAVSLKN